MEMPLCYVFLRDSWHAHGMIEETIFGLTSNQYKKQIHMLFWYISNKVAQESVCLSPCIAATCSIKSQVLLLR